jgi:hypothetical protein
MIGVLGFDCWRGLGIFLFTTAFRTALGPTQSPIRWVPGAFSLGVKRPGREATHSPSSSADVKECVELYLHSPNTLSWRGAQLKHRDNFTFYLYLYTHTHTHTHTQFSSSWFPWICICNYRTCRSMNYVESQKSFQSLLVEVICVHILLLCVPDISFLLF